MSIGENTLYPENNPPATPSPVGQPAAASYEPALYPTSQSQPVRRSLPVDPVSQAPATPPISSTPAAPEVSQPQPVSPPPAGPPSAGSRFSLGMILKIGIGAGIFFLLLFVIIAVVLPIFSRPKVSSHVTLTYWGLWEDAPIMQPLINGFEREHPEITINYIKEDPAQYRERVMTRIKNGNGPDIFRFHNSWVPTLTGYLLPFSQDIMTPSEFKNEYYPVMQTDLIKNGAIYGIPLEIDTLSLFVNSDILTSAGVQVPKTWNDFITASKQLTVKDTDGNIKTAGAALGTYDNVTHAPDILSMLFVQQGADLTNLAGSKDDVAAALKFYTSFASDQGNVWDGTLDNSLTAFAKGNLAMYFGYSWDILTIKAIDPNLHFAIYPVPNLYGRDMTVASYWVEGVSATTKHPKEALEFMKYLSQKESEQTFYSATVNSGRPVGEPYARQDLASLLKDNPLAAPFVAQGNKAISSYFIAQTSDGDHGINSITDTYLGNAVRSILGDTSPESAADTLVQGVTQTLSQYGK